MPSVLLWRKAVTEKVRAWGGLRGNARVAVMVSHEYLIYKATHSHSTSEKKFPTLLIRLWCHCYSLQENIPLDDELGRHKHVSRQIIVGVSQGCDTDICENGLGAV
jgi:hypothetical protein